MPYDNRSKDRTTALTEVRTVHSRALSAIDLIESVWGGDTFDDPDYPPAPTRLEGESLDDFNVRWRPWFEGRLAAQIEMADPDHEEMLAALRQVAELLEPWKKAGARRRR